MLVFAWLDLAGKVCFVQERFVQDRQGWVGQGLVRHGLAGMVRRGSEWFVRVRFGNVWRGMYF